jgi:hypothetical protein
VLDLEQAASSEIGWAQEGRLVLHYKFKSLTKNIRWKSILELDAFAVVGSIRHPIFTHQEPVARGPNHALRVISDQDRADLNGWYHGNLQVFRAKLTATAA